MQEYYDRRQKQEPKCRCSFCKIFLISLIAIILVIKELNFLAEMDEKIEAYQFLLERTLNVTKKYAPTSEMEALIIQIAAIAPDFIRKDT